MPLVAQAPQHVEQARDVGFRQAAVGSSSTRRSHLHGHGAGDRDDRLLGRRQIADARVRVDAAAHARESGLRGVARCAPGDQAAAARIAGEDRDILGDRHRVDEAEILMDEGDRQLFGRRIDRRGRRGGSRPASARCTPARTLISVDLPAPFSPSSACTSPAPDVEIDRIERQRAGEALGEPPDLRARGAAFVIGSRDSCRLRRSTGVLPQRPAAWEEIGDDGVRPAPPCRPRTLPAISP